MFRLTCLPAEDGDCLLLSYGSEEAARHVLIDGGRAKTYRAGIPYFSAGVQHLRDGLFLYAARDEEAKVMLDTVSRLSRRIDNGQIFTVIRYPKS